MDNIRLDSSDYVRYVLKSEYSPSITLTDEPAGWDDDDNEYQRDKKWHGMFSTITSDLEFRTAAKDYIEKCFYLGGHNATLYIIKYVLKKSSHYKIEFAETQGFNDLDFEIDYIGFADWETRGIKDDALTLVFKTDRLKELILAQQGNTFELERLDDIAGNEISKLELEEVYIQGRAIQVTTTSDLPEVLYNTEIFRGNYGCVVPGIVNEEGTFRHSLTVAYPFNEVTPVLPVYNADLMFYANDTAAVPNVDLKIRVSSWLKFGYTNTSVNARYVIRKLRYNAGTADYDVIQEWVIAPAMFQFMAIYYYELEVNVAYNEGLILMVDCYAGVNNDYFIEAKQNFIQITGVEDYVPTNHMKFLPINKIGERLMEIITGDIGLFYSKLFGRLSSDGDTHKYAETGEFGEVGVTCGYWAREFTSASTRYKSMQISIDEFLKSLKAVMNTGVSIDTINGTPLMRIEKQQYYYQQTVVVKLEGSISALTRKTDKTLYFGAVETGYSKGGDYENEVGLDEPNTKNEYVSPLKYAKTKFSQLSKIRADEYGMEILRRKPEHLYPDEDMSGDEDNWFLDLKEVPPSTGYNWVQKEWEDLLQQPPSGVLQPETFRSFRFTPSQIFERHGAILRAGLEQQINQDKFFKWTSSKANSFLEMLFIGDTESTIENQDIMVGSLDRPFVLPEVVTVIHPITEELLELIKGTTRIEVNGEFEDIPNVYFKFEFTYNGKRETGHLLSVKPKLNEFIFQIANENLIY